MKDFRVHLNTREIRALLEVVKYAEDYLDIQEKNLERMESRLYYLRQELREGNTTPEVLREMKLLKETGMRPGEACCLTWVNVDVERNVVTLNNPEKGSNSRIFKVSSKLIAMLNSLPKKSERIFPQTRKSITSNLFQIRKRIAAKLQNPRLLNISAKTFRHWKGTMLAHQTKDPFYVMSFLGHKNIQNTMKYIHLQRTLFAGESNDEFHVKVAETAEEACKLVEVGFEYVTTIENVQIFRRRK